MCRVLLVGLCWVVLVSMCCVLFCVLLVYSILFRWVVILVLGCFVCVWCSSCVVLVRLLRWNLI